MLQARCSVGITESPVQSVRFAPVCGRTASQQGAETEHNMRSESCRRVQPAARCKQALKGRFGLLVLFPRRRRQAAGQQHLLQQLVLGAPDALVLGDRKVGQQVVVAHVRGVAVPVDVHCPLETVQVSVPRAHVLCLRQMGAEQAQRLPSFTGDKIARGATLSAMRL